jgi:hypothetical protein
MIKQVNELQYDFFKLIEELECDCWNKTIATKKLEVLESRAIEILNQDNSYFYRLMHEVQYCRELIKIM